MNISREKTGELEQTIKVELSEADYQETLQKQLKSYRQKATVPGFRKGMAPMGLIERMYKTSIIAETVENMLGEKLDAYIDEQKLDIFASPLLNAEKTEAVDFEKDKDFVFYYDIAVTPEWAIDWSKIDEKLCKVNISEKDIDDKVDEVTKRYGKFETPETVGENDFVYGRVVEMDANGGEKEGGLSLFTSFEISSIQDEEIKNLFLGKKMEETIIFSAHKAFDNGDLMQNFRITYDVAKDFKSDVKFTISGCSHILPHAIDEELFTTAFPGVEIKDEAAFRQALRANMERNNMHHCRMVYVSHVRKALKDQYDAPLPETFLKRWILSRGVKDITPESIDTDWEDKYLPSIKWELLEKELDKIEVTSPSEEEVRDYARKMLTQDESIAAIADERERIVRIEKIIDVTLNDKESGKQLYENVYADKQFNLFVSKLHPAEKEMTLQEFNEFANV